MKIDVKLRKDTPVGVVRLLTEYDYTNDIECVDGLLAELRTRPLVIPNDVFFTLPGWESCLSMLNFEDSEGLKLRWTGYNWRLQIETEFKNYNGEIEALVKWIAPYVSSRKKKQYIGTYKYEGINRWMNIYINRSTNGRIRVEA